MKKLKVITVVGTRPEIIRLAEIIKKLDKHTNHKLVHTNQNFDKELNNFFFRDLNLRKPDYIFKKKTFSSSEQIGHYIFEITKILIKEKPNAFIVLGDTNSCLTAIAAKKLKIPIFHIEAGDRSFDINVPEETNRKIIDHISDVNIAYTEHSRRNLLREGIHPENVYVVGSPVKEVYSKIMPFINKSQILKKLNLKKNNYFAASIHREENVDIHDSFTRLIECYDYISKKFSIPIIVSTHPRTKAKLKNNKILKNKLIKWHKPFGLIDYLKLQLNSKCVISDSGTIHEDSSILNFPAVAIRKSTEKIESIENGNTIITGLEKHSLFNSINFTLSNKSNSIPDAYNVDDVSNRVVKIIIGMSDLVKEKTWR